MKKILNSGLALILLAITSLTASAQLLYIDDANNNLGTVNLANGTVTVLGTSNVALRDIGFTSSGTLYGLNGTSFYSVNANSGFATLVGNFGATGSGYMDALTSVGPTLYAASNATNQIYTINTSPYKVTTLTGTLTGNTFGDITSGANGTLYDILTTGVLDKITISAGGTAITTVAIGNTGNQKVSGMATEANGTILAISGTQIYTVDTTTALLIPLFNYAGHGLTTVYGAAIFNPAAAVVPEPSNIALLLAGVAGLVLYQKRRLAAKLV